MNIFGILSLVIALAIGTWWLAQGIESVQTENSEPGVYQNALDSAREAAGTASGVPKTNSELGLPAPVETVDPDTGKSITIYDGMSFSEGTTVINLSNQGLSGSLKAEVRFLSNLTELNLSGNNFTGLPAEIGQLSKLQVLNLANNPLTGLPYELGNLKNLKVLDLRGTNYAQADLEIIKQGLPATAQVLVD